MDDKFDLGVTLAKSEELLAPPPPSSSSVHHELHLCPQTDRQTQR